MLLLTSTLVADWLDESTSGLSDTSRLRYARWDCKRAGGVSNTRRACGTTCLTLKVAEGPTRGTLVSLGKEVAFTSLRSARTLESVGGRAVMGWSAVCFG